MECECQGMEYPYVLVSSPEKEKAWELLEQPSEKRHVPLPTLFLSQTCTRTLPYPTSCHFSQPLCYIARLFFLTASNQGHPCWLTASKLDTDFFSLKGHSWLLPYQLWRVHWKTPSEMDQMPKELKLENFVEEIDAGSSLQRSAVGWLYWEESSLSDSLRESQASSGSVIFTNEGPAFNASFSDNGLLIDS